VVCCHSQPRRASPRSASAGVRGGGCTIPGAGKPGFSLADHEIELGLGIHGEKGVERTVPLPADALVDTLLSSIVADLVLDRGERVALFVNGLGATPVEELYILYRSVAEQLAGAGLSVRRVWVGEYATSLEMAGASVSLLRIDPELARLMDAPARSPLFDRF